MNRCTGMPRTWSGVLWIDFEVKIDLNIVLQRVELKRELDSQIQYHKTCTNESYRPIPNLDFSRSITPSGIFYLEQHEILSKSGVSDVNFSVRRTISPKTG